MEELWRAAISVFRIANDPELAQSIFGQITAPASFSSHGVYTGAKQNSTVLSVVE
jgi:hypothetical protein